MPRLARCSASTARISACVVTSSAVVGSSQMSRRGELVSAPAIMTRCSIPPESSCGYWRRCSSGRGIRTDSSSDEATALASAVERCSHNRIVSVRWSPTVRIGLMPARGSWKIIDALVRRRSSSSLRLASSTDRPSSCTEPPVRALAGSNPSTERAVSDLPEPDSPTRPTVSPSATVRLMPSSSLAPFGRSSVSSEMSRSVMRGSLRRCGLRVLRRSRSRRRPRSPPRSRGRSREGSSRPSRPPGPR